MKTATLILSLFALLLSTNGAALPELLHLFQPRSVTLKNGFDIVSHKGGSGGRGGSSGVSAGSSSGSKSSSSGSSGKSSISSSSSAPRSYGGGRYYAGGANTAFSAGKRSPSGIAPFLLLTPAIYFAGLWAYDVYDYPFPRYSFRNLSDPTSTANTTLPVNCLCQRYSPCGCDDEGSNSTLDAIVGNGTITNPSLARLAVANGSSTLFINGTLVNSTSSAANVATAAAGLWSGWAVIVAGVAYTVLFA